MPGTEETNTGVEGQQAAAAEETILGEEAGQAATGEETGEEGTQATAEEQIAAFKAKALDETTKRQAAEAQVQNMTSQFDAMQQQQQQTAQPQQQTAKSFFKEQYGLEGDELPSVEQVEGYTQHLQQQGAIATQQSNLVAKTQRFISGKTDFTEKVGVYGPAGFMPSAEFQKALTADPSLAEDYMSQTMTVQSAYRAVTAFQATNELAVMKQTVKEQKAQKGAALKTGPMSPAAVGGGGSVNQGLNAGLDSSTPEGKAAILANFESMREGDYDPEDD